MAPASPERSSSKYAFTAATWRSGGFPLQVVGSFPTQLPNVVETHAYAIAGSTPGRYKRIVPLNGPTAALCGTTSEFSAFAERAL